MSAPINDGGPAFPFREEDGGGGYFMHPGMTLRDWFAGQALCGLTSNPTSYEGAIKQHREKTPNFTDADVCATLARWSYDYADAMLAARAKKASGQ